jgi:Leucine-rich repeat (LRR) protein
MENQLAGFHVLDSQYAFSQMPVSRGETKELNASNQDIVRIGNLCDVAFLRKINISFNKITTLVGIDQLNQLRELLAYSNSIEDISNLQSLNKLEKVYLQHNKITSLSNTFQQMNKLQELRLDKNKISKIEYLKDCAALKKLNLANNTLQGCEGIQGLQFLVELNLSNNNIKSILPLKGLPNLKEFDVSHNQLKSLDGIQYLMKLEILKADHNHIVHLQIPVYGAGGGNSVKSGRSANTGITKSTQGKPNSSQASGNSKPGSASTGNESLPEIEGPCIIELYLSGNRIKSIKGLETFQKTMEILDLSFNQITNADLVELSNSSLKTLVKLTEIRFYNNPCTDNPNSQEFLAVKKLLQDNCPDLQAIDDHAILKRSSSHQGEKSLISMDSKEFHTWERGEDGSVISSIHENEDESTIKSSKAETKSAHREEDDLGYSSSSSDDSRMKSKKSSKTNKKPPVSSKSSKSGIKKEGGTKQRSESKIMENFDEEEEESDENDPEKVNERLGLKVPKLTLKSLLTEEQIQEKEGDFLSLLNKTKSILENTLFKFEQLQKLSAEEFSAKQKEILEPDDELNSPLPHDGKKRVYKIKKDEKLSEKLVSALDKALEAKVEKDPVYQEIATVKLISEDASYLSALPVDEGFAAAKSSVLTDQPVPINQYTLDAGTPVNIVNTAKGVIAQNLSDDASQMKIPKEDSDNRSVNTKESIQTSKSKKSLGSNSNTSSKFAEKVMNDVNTSFLTSGKTLHGSKQSKKNDFLISNSFLTKNNTVLHQQSPLSLTAEKKDELEDVDFLNLKMSKKEKKLSYLQWRNLDGTNPSEEKNAKENFEITENEESVFNADEVDLQSQPSKISLDTALLLEKMHENNREDFESEVIDSNSPGSVSRQKLEMIEEVSPERVKLDTKAIQEMYTKPHTIGFDSRYGVANDISLLLPSTSDELLSELQQNLFSLLTPKTGIDKGPLSSR